mgnify:CR=1 FL=1
MVDPDITDLQKKADHFESQYNALKKEFKDFIETTKKNEELKKKDLQSENAKKMLVVADSLCRMMNSTMDHSCDALRSVHTMQLYTESAPALQPVESMRLDLINMDLQISIKKNVSVVVNVLSHAPLVL